MFSSGHVRGCANPKVVEDCNEICVVMYWSHSNYAPFRESADMQVSFQRSVSLHNAVELRQVHIHNAATEGCDTW